MTLVGFYVVQAADQARRLEVAVRLADKAFQSGHRIFINATDEDLSEEESARRVADWAATQQ